MNGMRYSLKYMNTNNRYCRYIHYCGEISGEMYTFTVKIPKIKNKSSRRVQQNNVKLCKKTGCKHTAVTCTYLCVCVIQH